MKKLISIVTLSFVVFFWQACDELNNLQNSTSGDWGSVNVNGGTIVSNPNTDPGPLDQLKFAISPFDPSPFSYDSELFVRDVKFCVGFFRAEDPDGKEIYLREIDDYISVNPNGTLIGFLPNEDLIDGEYDAYIYLRDRCDRNHSVKYFNKYGKVRTGNDIIIHKIMKKHTDLNNEVTWSIDLQVEISRLTQVEKDDHVKCAFDPKIRSYCPDFTEL